MSALHPTRRALLGAIAVAPVAAMPLAAVAAEAGVLDGAAWSRAMAEYQAATDAMNAYDRDFLTPVAAMHMAVRDRWPVIYDFSSDPTAEAALASASEAYDPVQERYDELADAQSDASEDLLMTPAPDLAALAQKLTIYVEDDCRNWTVGKQLSEALMHDARRLAGLPPVRLRFDHSGWMSQWSDAGGGLAEIDGQLELMVPGERTPGDRDALAPLMAEIDSYGDEGRSAVLRTWRARREAGVGVRS